ncbi:hypothetical protein K438DRAFT_1882765 [Mycena galopus ATCC 62051]|nr:hypothetical protein K438DRAFT_1882765 [Mycena galopus ATCC 62051]
MDEDKSPFELRDTVSIAHGGPLSFVPFEILAKIFLQFRDIALEESPPSLQTLMTVSQVCGLWRDVAHRTRELWVHMPLNFHSRRHYRRLRKLLDQWAARSHPRPLTVTVRSCYPRPENPVIDFIFTNASRICELSLDIPAAHFHRFLQAPAGSFPVLEKLTMDVIAESDATYDGSWGVSRHEYFRDAPICLGEPDEGPVWGALAAITALRNTPRLHSIKIATSCFGELDARMLPLAWTNLTHIDLQSVALSVEDTAYLLPQCTRARLLRFATQAKTLSSMPPIARVCLPELTELTWCGFDVDDFSIFDPLILPRLASLKLRQIRQKTLYSLKSNATFSLRKLKLILVRLDDERFFKFLSEMPSLTSLDLHISIAITDNFFRFLTYDSHANAVLPNLEYLRLAEWKQDFSETIMLRMLESRWGSTPFKEGEVRTNLDHRGVKPAPTSEHRGVQKRIMELVKEGLKFKYEN